jgi:hypothetical protein
VVELVAEPAHLAFMTRTHVEEIHRG